MRKKLPRVIPGEYLQSLASRTAMAAASISAASERVSSSL